MEFGIITIIHAILALLLIIELGLTGYGMFNFPSHKKQSSLSASNMRFSSVVDITTGPWHSAPSSFAFLLFCTIWSILVLLYLALTPRFFARAYNAIVALGLLAVTAIFWFAGAIAMAVDIGAYSHGGHDYRTAQAAVAFAFFIWAIFTGLAVMEGLAFMRGRGHGATADTRAKPAAYPGA